WVRAGSTSSGVESRVHVRSDVLFCQEWEVERLHAVIARFHVRSPRRARTQGLPSRICGSATMRSSAMCVPVGPILVREACLHACGPGGGLRLPSRAALA